LDKQLGPHELLDIVNVGKHETKQSLLFGQSERREVGMKLGVWRQGTSADE